MKGKNNKRRQSSLLPFFSTRHQLLISCQRTLLHEFWCLKPPKSSLFSSGNSLNFSQIFDSYIMAYGAASFYIADQVMRPSLTRSPWGIQLLDAPYLIYFMDSMKITIKGETKRRINMGEVGTREGGKSPYEEGLFQKEKQAKPLSTMNQINFHIEPDQI